MNGTVPSQLTGTECVLVSACLLDAERATLKERSPACGVNLVYNNRVLVDGCGVTAALLIREGIAVEAAS
jgi:uncharacterized protein YbbK (DUF523 family)